MPCFVAVLALFVPRLVILGLWFLTSWFEGIFTSLLWPILGFLFAPTTLIWYTVVHNVWGGNWDLLQIVGLVVAILIDLSPSSGKRDKR